MPSKVLGLRERSPQACRTVRAEPCRITSQVVIRDLSFRSAQPPAGGRMIQKETSR